MYFINSVRDLEVAAENGIVAMGQAVQVQRSRTGKILTPYSRDIADMTIQEIIAEEAARVWEKNASTSEEGQAAIASECDGKTADDMTEHLREALHDAKNGHPSTIYHIRKATLIAGYIGHEFGGELSDLKSKCLCLDTARKGSSMFGDTYKYAAMVLEGMLALCSADAHVDDSPSGDSQFSDEVPYVKTLNLPTPIVWDSEAERGYWLFICDGDLEVFIPAWANTSKVDRPMFIADCLREAETDWDYRFKAEVVESVLNRLAGYLTPGGLK